MEIIIKEKQLDTENYKIGDLFLIKWTLKETVSMLVQEQDKYILRRMDYGLWTGANGYHDSISELFEEIDSIGAKVLEHYSRDDYELHLVKK